ncbi:hypothetical protein BBO99_00004924 [Phytophthora kernoviae]|uniref:Mitochondrial folate transporter/carrier n=2 Tax=Phytophthora kernoviae TaxID=325452 RepID=A0A421GQ58_9STRA|nr:hypothetical protein G195_006584 [Phytophthora kernoviae 00238/432]KAG2524164.1 hypothetical protein JM16_002613 [Phytophthora kernoviae]KAG2524643.1 hypothetical protein JM18_005209 [Phytophthora kernoviae]RLN26343.1 hypothetical protein BBI17_006139 [Phytophthora kernoviae]RLN79897.1 hypothetical protein BBO99_00004924 [Phytophthora kernoviae]
MTMKELLSEDQWRSVVHTVAGLGAGAVSTVMLYPLDLVKVRYQVHEKSAHAYRSLGHAFRSIVAEEGVRALFRGMSPALYGATLSWGIYMLVYQSAKERYARMADEGWIQGSWQHFFSGIEAGCICVPLTNPIWLIKIRMQFVAYEQLKSIYLTHWSPEMDMIPTLAMGAVAQSIASTATYPYQLIKARLQQGGPSALKYSGTWDCTKKIIKNEGYNGLFKGLSANILKVMPTGAIVFAAYEQIQSTMNTLLLDK